MPTTPLRSREYEYTALAQGLVTKDPSFVPLAVRAELVEEYRAEGLSLFRTRTAGHVRGPDWRLDFGILDDEGLLTVMLGDLFNLPRRERERIAGYVAVPPVNARFLKMKLGMGACSDEGEIVPWEGPVGEAAPGGERERAAKRG